MDPVTVDDKPLHALFLDIDGVLNHEGSGRHPVLDKIDAIMQERFGEARGHTFRCSTCVRCKKIEVSLFDAGAIEALTNLLHKISALAEVHIVISSTWRLGKSTEELRALFAEHAFAKYIVDKTTDDDLTLEEHQIHCSQPSFLHDSSLENLHAFMEKNGLLLTQDTIGRFLNRHGPCRGSQIKKWLHLHPQYKSYTILDDFDSHLTVNFEQDYIETKHGSMKILTPDDGERAWQQFLQRRQSPHG